MYKRKPFRVVAPAIVEIEPNSVRATPLAGTPKVQELTFTDAEGYQVQVRLIEHLALELRARVGREEPKP